jgi:hypothetical protein
MTPATSTTRLSPLNFQQLIHRHQAFELGPMDSVGPTEPKNIAIECWKCPECLEVYDDEFEAEECCMPDEDLHHKAAPVYCPVCGDGATDHRDAADCCLWKDIDAETRWAMADKVEAGASWADLLPINRKDITQ